MCMYVSSLYVYEIMRMYMRLCTCIMIMCMYVSSCVCLWDQVHVYVYEVHVYVSSCVCLWDHVCVYMIMCMYISSCVCVWDNVYICEIVGIICIVRVLSVCCSVLHCVAVCCSVLQCVAVCWHHMHHEGSLTRFSRSGICYRVAKTHRIPYLYRSFSAQVTYIWWLFCGKWSAT